MPRTKLGKLEAILCCYHFSNSIFTRHQSVRGNEKRNYHHGYKNDGAPPPLSPPPTSQGTAMGSWIGRWDIADIIIIVIPSARCKLLLLPQNIENIIILWIIRCNHSVLKHHKSKLSTDPAHQTRVRPTPTLIPNSIPTRPLPPRMLLWRRSIAPSADMDMDTHARSDPFLSFFSRAMEDLKTARAAQIVLENGMLDKNRKYSKDDWYRAELYTNSFWMKNCIIRHYKNHFAQRLLINKLVSVSQRVKSTNIHLFRSHCPRNVYLHKQYLCVQCFQSMVFLFTYLAHSFCSSENSFVENAIA